MKKYITLSASANGALLSVSKYQGVNYVVAPVISAVGDTVIFPANAPYPEFVPGEVLSLATESRNFRPVVMNHPWDDSKQEYCSANSPEVLEKYRYGFVFNSRFEDGRVKADIWLDPIRAAEVGPEALRVIERLQAGEIVEVSEGSYVIVDETPGIYNGDEYGGKWELCIPDHLATLSEGTEGACSVNKHGCGANRVSSSNQPDIVNQLWLSLSEVEEEFEFVLGHTSDKVVYCNTPDYLENGDSIERVWSRNYQVKNGKVILSDRLLESSDIQVAKAKKIRANKSSYRFRLNTLKQARTPKFTGTETTNWSVPTFSQYIKYLYPGENGPKSVSQCSSELKREISSHSLLGDPEGKTLADLTLFPVVNPSNGKLNEKALRNVISGKGKPDDLPESAYQSAIDTAKRLLNSEFGSSLEVAKVVDKKKQSTLARFLSMFRVDMSSNRLYHKLWTALLEVEPGLITIVDHDPDEKTVIYSTMIRFGSYDYPDYNQEYETHIWTRSFAVDADENVTILDGKVEVEYQETYVPVKVKDDTTLEVSSESEKPCSCKGDQSMTFNRDSTIKKLVASKKFTETELKSSSDSVLKALEESLEKPAVNEPAEENKSADHGDKTIIENTPEDQKEEKKKELATDQPKDDKVTLTREEYEDLKSMKPAADAFKASQAKKKDNLVKVLSTHQTEYKEDELKKMEVTVLERMANMLKVEQTPTVNAVDYSFARSFEVKDEQNEAPPVLSVAERIKANRAKRSA